MSTYEYNCESCEREFADEYGLGRHNAAKHGGDPPSPSLRRQNQSPKRGKTSAGGAFACGTCSKKFASQRGMERHCTAKDHEEGGYDALGEVEARTSGRKRRRKPQGVAAASVAAREARRVAPLGTGRFACLECGKRFVTENGLARHQGDKDHQGSEQVEALVLDGIIGCSVCGKVFGSARGLERHCAALDHDGDNGSAAAIEAARAVCVCGKVLRSQHALDRHMAAKGCGGDAAAASNGGEAVVGREDSGPVFCHACDRECKSERSLQRHLDSTGHRDEPVGGASYVCGSCERVLDSMHALGRHQEAFDHTGSSSHPGRDFGIQCPNCFRKFATESGLAPHIEEKHLPYEDDSDVDGDHDGVDGDHDGVDGDEE